VLSVVVPEEPGLCGAETVDPTPVAIDARRAGAGVGERSHFNGLLVERGPDIAGSCAARGRDGQMTVHRLVVEQPRQEIQAVLQQHRSAQRRAGGDHRLGQDGVGVAESSLRPWPGGICAGRRHTVRSVSQKCVCPTMVGLHREQLGCSERGKRHRTRVWRPLR
jgi:hypothetical protein